MSPTDFATDHQYLKWVDCKEFFEALIELSGQPDISIFIDGTVTDNVPYIDGWEMGFRSMDGLSSVLFLGDIFNLNPQTGEYDLPYVDQSRTSLRNRITAGKFSPVRVL